MESERWHHDKTLVFRSGREGVFGHGDLQTEKPLGSAIRFTPAYLCVVPRAV